MTGGFPSQRASNVGFDVWWIQPHCLLAALTCYIDFSDTYFTSDTPFVVPYGEENQVEAVLNAFGGTRTNECVNTTLDFTWYEKSYIILESLHLLQYDTSHGINAKFLALSCLSWCSVPSDFTHIFQGTLHALWQSYVSLTASEGALWSLLVTWVNFNPNMDK